MRQPGKMLEGRAFSSGRATPERAFQVALPQKSDVSPRAVTPRKARRPYGRESSGGLSCGVSISARYRRAGRLGLRISYIVVGEAAFEADELRVVARGDDHA